MKSSPACPKANRCCQYPWRSNCRTARPASRGKKVKNRFGYGLHLITDSHYEIPAAFHVTPASHSEPVELTGMIDELFKQSPAVAEHCKDFSADRGLDSGPLKATYGFDCPE